MEMLRKSTVKWQLDDVQKRLIYKQWVLNYATHLEEHYNRFKQV
jgi:hypothetical protein